MKYLAGADLRVLLMALYQLTGEERWLQPLYLPGRDVKLIADEDAGLPPEVQAEIRRAAAEVLAIPIFGELGEARQRRVADVIIDYLRTERGTA